MISFFLFSFFFFLNKSKKFRRGLGADGLAGQRNGGGSYWSEISLKRRKTGQIFFFCMSLERMQDAYCRVMLFAPVHLIVTTVLDLIDLQ